MAPVGAVTVGAVPSTDTALALYSKPVSVWSPLATAGKVMVTGAALPVLSVTVTVTVPPAPAAVGVPLISPVPMSMVNPAGSPVAAYDPISVLAPVGVMAVILSPTFNEAGAA